MAQIQMFFQQNAELGFTMMILCVLLITQLIKLPIKHFTKRINNEDARKAVNGVFFVVAVCAGILVEYLYSLFTKTTFKVELGIIFAGMGVSSHKVYEVIRNVARCIIPKIFTGKKINIKEVTDIIDDGVENDTVDDNKNNLQDAMKNFEDSLK